MLLKKKEAKKKAWPGKAEMLYLLFAICWNPFRALRTSNTDFLLFIFVACQAKPGKAKINKKQKSGIIQ